VSEVVASVLRLKADDFSETTGFEQLGVDSIVAVEVVDRLNAVFGSELRSVDLFNHATMERMAQRLLEVSPASVKAAVEPPVPAPVTVVRRREATGNPEPLPKPVGIPSSLD